MEAGPGLGRVKLEVEVAGGLAPPERRGQQRQVARLGRPVGGALEVAWHNQYQAELRSAQIFVVAKPSPRATHPRTRAAH